MVVLVVERVAPSLRGELTRWLIELRPHVYVGNVNARIRDQLWQLACQKAKGGAIVQIWSSPNEQGFSARSWGSPDYFLRDFEGVLLVERPQGGAGEGVVEDLAQLQRLGPVAGRGSVTHIGLRHAGQRVGGAGAGRYQADAGLAG